MVDCGRYQKAQVDTMKEKTRQVSTIHIRERAKEADSTSPLRGNHPETGISHED